MNVAPQWKFRIILLLKILKKSEMCTLCRFRNYFWRVDTALNTSMNRETADPIKTCETINTR